MRDIKHQLRLQASRALPRFSLTADGESAHRTVANHPSDWGLQACALNPRGHLLQ